MKNIIKGYGKERMLGTAVLSDYQIFKRRFSMSQFLNQNLLSQITLKLNLLGEFLSHLIDT
jgi:hypothetical protein